MPKESLFPYPVGTLVEVGGKWCEVLANKVIPKDIFQKVVELGYQMEGYRNEDVVGSAITFIQHKPLQPYTRAVIWVKPI